MINKRQTKLITGVHNYCDNWCERCPFTQRCAVGVAEHELTDAQKDLNNEAFWKNLSNNFAKTFKLLQKTAEKKGLDLTPPTDEELLEFERKDAETRAIIQQKPLIETTNLYRESAINWFKNNDKTFENKGFEFIKHIEMGNKNANCAQATSDLSAAINATFAEPSLSFGKPYSISHASSSIFP